MPNISTHVDAWDLKFKLDDSPFAGKQKRKPKRGRDRGNGIGAILLGLGPALWMALWRIARGPQRHVAKVVRGVGCAGIAAGALTFFPNPGKGLVGLCFALYLPPQHCSLPVLPTEPLVSTQHDLILWVNPFNKANINRYDCRVFFPSWPAATSMALSSPCLHL